MNMKYQLIPPPPATQFMSLNPLPYGAELQSLLVIVCECVTMGDDPLHILTGCTARYQLQRCALNCKGTFLIKMQLSFSCIQFIFKSYTALGWQYPQNSTSSYIWCESAQSEVIPSGTFLRASGADGCACSTCSSLSADSRWAQFPCIRALNDAVSRGP